MARSRGLAVGAYVVVVAAPLALSATQPLGRGLVVNLSIALGFVALAVLGLQLAPGPRLSSVTHRFGVDAAQRYHRQITLLAVTAAFAHPAILFATSSGYRQLMDIWHDPLR